MDNTNEATVVASLPVEERLDIYWNANKRVLYTLLTVWAFVTFGCGILLADWLDRFQFFGFPLGFWFTQQGAMIFYVALIFIYHFWMKKIERYCGFIEQDPVKLTKQLLRENDKGA